MKDYVSDYVFDGEDGFVEGWFINDRGDKISFFDLTIDQAEKMAKSLMEAIDKAKKN